MDVFSTTNIVIVGLIFLSVLVLQAFLSLRRLRLLGLILPFTCFAFSMYVIVHFNQLIGNHGFEGYEVWGWYGLQLFVGNIPTFILLLIFFLFKRRPDISDDDMEEDLVEQSRSDLAKTQIRHKPQPKRSNQKKTNTKRYNTKK